jgi:hypothetical protein
MHKYERSKVIFLRDNPSSFEYSSCHKGKKYIKDKHELSILKQSRYTARKKRLKYT